MFKRILVPLDCSSFGEAALGPAAALARRTGGELRLLNVHERGWNPKRRLSGSEDREWREEYLTGVGRGLLQVQLDTVVREGQPERQILDEAESWGADIIVMSTHGRGGVSRLWLGSVADHCVRHASVPLLLVRAQPSGENNVEALYSRRRIVVPLDGSELAERALPAAAALSEGLHAPLGLVRVVQPVSAAAPVGMIEEGPETTNLEVACASADAYLTDVSRRLFYQGTVMTTEVVIDRNPAKAIIEHADGDLVVMSTHSRRPLERAVLGSVTDKVMRGSRGPVVVIPASSTLRDASAPRFAEETAAGPSESDFPPGARIGSWSVPEIP